MTQYHIYKFTSLLALKRLIINLIKKDELTSDKIDSLSSLGSIRGFSVEHVWEIVMDCQIENSVD